MPLPRELLNVPPGRTLLQHCVNVLADGLSGKLDEQPQDAELEALREKCRQGNPFPLVAYQWPEFVVSDPVEARYFEGMIGDAENPCLRLDFWQRQIIAAFFDDLIVEVFQKGNTRSGKGCSTSIGVNLWFDVWRECKIILTSSDYEHACKNIYGEIRMWRDRMVHPGPGRVGAEGITDLPEHYIVVRNPLRDEGFSGQHGPRTLFVFDESSGVREGLYDNALKQFRKIIALSNPRTLFGWFRNGFKKCDDENRTQIINGDFGRRLCVTIGGLSCLNVREKRLEKPIAPPGGVTIDGRDFAAGDAIPPEFFAKVKPLIPNQVDYGRFMGICQHSDSRHVDIYAHGKFPTEDPEKQVILQSWLAFHESAWSLAAPPGVEAFGLDVARSLDGDATCLAAGGQQGVRATHKWKYADITYHVAEAIRLARELYGIDLRQCRHPVCVDMDGLGAGVGDQLRQLGVWVIEFRGNATSQVDPRIYGNLRAEAYGTLGRRLNPDDQWGGRPWALPANDNLRQELCAPEKIYDADALRFRITPKHRSPDHEGKVVSIRDKLGRSPDEADAVVYLWHAVRTLHNWNEWFASYSAAPMLLYPAAGQPSFVDPARAEVPGGSPALAAIIKENAGLVGADPLPPEEVKEKLELYRQQMAAAQRDADYAHLPPAQQPKPDDWLNRVQWSGD